MERIQETNQGRCLVCEKPIKTNSQKSTKYTAHYSCQIRADKISEIEFFLNYEKWKKQQKERGFEN
jgi:hypothetical protein